MTAIWKNDGKNWQLIAPQGFPDEAALHSLVEKAPQILPLAGTPRLIILGREVLLGNGYADLIAIEPSGRIVVIEVKLARNAEARRAVVAQVLTYAAYLNGLSAADLEINILGRHLRERGYDTLAHAVATNDQEGSFDAEEFAGSIVESLSQGRFRLVLVLDEAPEELIRLVGYLESVSDKLSIDLITVSAYRIEESEILIPQRVDAERKRVELSVSPPRLKPEVKLVDGSQDFADAIAKARDDQKASLKQLCDWANLLEREGISDLVTYHGKLQLSLLPRLRDDKVGLVTIYNFERGCVSPILEKRLRTTRPKSLIEVERLMAPTSIGQGTAVRTFNDPLFAALTRAYREAATGVVIDAIGGEA